MDTCRRYDTSRSPRTNGFVERMNRTLLDECFRVTGRTTWYLEPTEIQRDLDRFLESRATASVAARWPRRSTLVV